MHKVKYHAIFSLEFKYSYFTSGELTKFNSPINISEFQNVKIR